MNEKAIKTLEFDKIREALSAYAQSDRGKSMCLSLMPESDFEFVRRLQEETEEAAVVLAWSGMNPIGAFSDTGEFAARAAKGSVLSPKMLLTIAMTLRCAANARKALITDRENTPRLRHMAEQLSALPLIEKEITTCILGEDEISDQASPDLADIRRHIRVAGEKIREKLNTMAHGASYAKYLMEPIVTVRNGRYVLPVRQECRASVPGLIHDQSSSGATLFIEPMAVVELGNDLKEWRGREAAEIERILRRLSALAGENASALETNDTLLAALDLIFAKAAFARALYCCAPKLNQAGLIRLNRARHPLISPEEVVPLNLWLGDEFTTLVITGPNTGGKTVTLKTIGLFALMAQSGMQIPADPGSELTVFEEVYADIGDEQSIEQSLSTFSAHMTNIVHIMDHVRSNDLVLLDELGAGTDPTEGAALAQTILDRLTRQKIRTAATTHYSELKAYALSTIGVENASVEFDVTSLRPTYRLSIGVPGKSNAFEISSRLGLSDDIIEGARKLLSSNTVRFEDVLANAEYHRQIAERERKLAEEARQETISLRQEAERLYRETEEKRKNASQKAREEARRILERARQEADTIVSELKKARRNAVDTNSIHALERQLDHEIDALRPEMDEGGAPAWTPPEKLKKGDKVEIIPMHAEATVLEDAEGKKDVQLQAGSMRLKMPMDRLRLLEAAASRPSRAQVHSRVDVKEMSASMSVDVRGMNAEEAIMEVSRFLDSCVMTGLHEVFIIHGKGSGILRSSIQQDLKNNRRVASFRNGHYGEGEEGVTVVTLK